MRYSIDLEGHSKCISTAYDKKSAPSVMSEKYKQIDFTNREKDIHL